MWKKRDARFTWELVLRIHGNFSDYYDSVQSYVYGDDDNHWVRKKESFQPKESMYKKWKKKIGYLTNNTLSDRCGYTTTSKYSNYKHFEFNLIGFCGKFYTIAKVSVPQKEGKDIITYITTSKEFEKYLKNDKQKTYTDRFFNNKVYSWWGGGNGRNMMNIIDDAFNNSSYTSNDLFFELKAPILHFSNDISIINKNKKESWNLRKGFININPTLKYFGFVKLFDPYQAYQEIEMYFFGVMGKTEKDITYIEDKYRISGKGFDNTSFRTKLTKKKRY